MKIRDIRAASLRGETPPGGWSNELRPEDSVHTLIAVETEDGVVGFGSVFTSGALVESSLEVLRPLCIGADAREPEHVSETLHRATFWQGRGGAITHTISGIDVALWDILGKVTGQPVSRLLGGVWRDRVKPYASLLMDEPAALQASLEAAKAQGFRAFKIGWGPFGRVSAAMDESIVRAARETVGDDADLMVDAGASDGEWRHGLHWAQRTADMLADYGIGWFEEALPPDALEDFVALRRSSTVPISGGEVLTRRQSFRPWLNAGAFDIVQPDVTKVGGLSEQRRIGWAAEDAGIRLIPHGWNTALGLAADLHLAGALATTDLVEYMAGSPYVDSIVTNEWTLDADGFLAIPTVPGLGVTLDEDALSRHTDDARRFLGSAR